VFFKKQVGYMRKQYPESTDADLVKAKTDFTQGNARNATQEDQRSRIDDNNNGKGDWDLMAVGVEAEAEAEAGVVTAGVKGKG
jgi:hypothetical protein